MFKKLDKYTSTVVGPGMKHMAKQGARFANRSMPGADTGNVCNVNNTIPCKNMLTDSCIKDVNSNNLFTCEKDPAKIKQMEKARKLATDTMIKVADKTNRYVDTIDPNPDKQKTEIRHANAASRINPLNQPLVRSNSGEFRAADHFEMRNKRTVDECCKTFRDIIAMCEDQIKKCKKSGCCSETSSFGGNKKSVKNTKRKNKVKSVKKKRSSQSGGKVHPWREHIKKTKLANPGVKDFGQIIQLAKETYKK